MKEQFEIIEINNQMMTLKANRSGGCHSCQANSSCGTGILASYFNHATIFHQPLQQGVAVGDFITLEISSASLFLRAFQLYLLPILALFAGASVGIMLFPLNELWQISLGLLSFSAAILAVKYFLK